MNIFKFLSGSKIVFFIISQNTRPRAKVVYFVNCIGSVIQHIFFKVVQMPSFLEL